MYSNLRVCVSKPSHLNELAFCHLDCFPASLAAKLGFTYVRKTLDWFLSADNRFLFHMEIEGQIVGYCGGFVPAGKGDGSSSGMLQHAFKEAVWGILKKPWLIFNGEVQDFYPFIFRNIRTKVIGKKKIKHSHHHERKHSQQYAGLVVIGIEPAFRGTNVFKELMLYFEKEAVERNVHLCNLSVKKDNDRAIHAYKKFGWYIAEEHGKTFVMQKKLL